MDTAIDIVVAAIALLALVVAYLANRNAARSAKAAEGSERQAIRSADAAERSAAAAEREAAAAESALPPPPPAVAWKAELIKVGRGGATYGLRNTGTDVAIGVQVSWPDSYDNLVRPDLGDGRIVSGGSFRVLVLDVDQLPNLMEVMVSWTGQPDPVIVPLPRR
jgi:hypothetical protein